MNLFRTNSGKEQDMIFGHHTAGLLGYSHLVGGYEGGQAEYLRVPFGRYLDFVLCGHRISWLIVGPSCGGLTAAWSGGGSLLDETRPSVGARQSTW